MVIVDSPVESRVFFYYYCHGNLFLDTMSDEHYSFLPPQRSVAFNLFEEFSHMKDVFFICINFGVFIAFFT